MRTRISPEWTLVLLLMAGLLINAWPGTSQFKAEDWASVEVTAEEEQIALDRYRQYKYLRSIGYYNQRFPLSAVEVSDEQYVWLILERLDYIIFGIVCFYMKPDPRAVKAYLFIKVLDLADHLIHYNEPYFSSGPFPITYNVASIAVFTTLVIWYRENTV